MNKKLLISLCGLALVGCGIDNTGKTPEKTENMSEESSQKSSEEVDPQYVKKKTITRSWTMDKLRRHRTINPRKNN